MKKQLSYALTCFYLGLSVSGCSDNLVQSETESSPMPITFSATAMSSSINSKLQTKASGDAFPNANIAIVATKTITGSTEDSWNWESTDLELNHKLVTVNNENAAGKYTISNNQVYWPLNQEDYLAFTAYSPATHATIKKKGDAGAPNDLKATELALEVNSDSKGFPDLLYLKKEDSKTTNAVGPYNKDQGATTVELGEFQHAMAKVKLKVMCIDYNNPTNESDYSKINITITSLSIGTKVTKGVFDFLTPSWALSTTTDFQTLYTLIDKGNTKMEKAYESTGNYYLFPSIPSIVDVAENSEIQITLNDGAGTHSYTQKIAQFTTDGTTPVTLVQGKITELTIKIKVMGIPDGGTGGIILLGTLTDWIDKGNSTIPIE